MADEDIKFKVKCNIEDGDPIFINLLGKGIRQPKDNIPVLKFSTVVRTSKVEKVQIKNSTDKPWKLKVIISSSSSHNYFSGKESLDVPPNGTANYEVIYTPLSMTKSPETPNVA